MYYSAPNPTSGKTILVFITSMGLLSAGSDCPAFGASEPRPYQLDLVQETVFAAAGLSFTLTGDYAVSRVHAPDPLTLNRDNIPYYDRIALDMHSRAAGTWSDRTRDISLAFPLLAAASVIGNGNRNTGRDAAIVLVMYAESNFLILGLTSLAKGTVQRSRPWAYNPDVPLDERRKRSAALSFWSGHTSTAFNSVVFAGTVFQAYHPDSPLVVPLWTAGLAAATSTAVIRVRAGQHFPSDVLAGAAVGSLTGWLIPRLHRVDAGTLRVSPTVSGAPGLGVNWAF